MAHKDNIILILRGDTAVRKLWQLRRLGFVSSVKCTQNQSESIRFSQEKLVADLARAQAGISRPLDGPEFRICLSVAGQNTGQGEAVVMFVGLTLKDNESDSKVRARRFSSINALSHFISKTSCPLN